MLVALGECYEKLNQLVEAKKVRTDVYDLRCLPEHWVKLQQNYVASAT